MSKIHALETNGIETRVVVHFAVPAGSNAFGFTWQAAGLVSGDLGQTVLTVGTSPGQITQAEMDAIRLGSVVERVIGVRVDSGGETTAQRLATANKYAADMVRDWVPVFKAKHKFFGYAAG